jgi:hypothetical protein
MSRGLSYVDVLVEAHKGIRSLALSSRENHHVTETKTTHAEHKDFDLRENLQQVIVQPDKYLATIIFAGAHALARAQGAKNPSVVLKCAVLSCAALSAFGLEGSDLLEREVRKIAGKYLAEHSCGDPLCPVHGSYEKGGL